MIDILYMCARAVSFVAPASSRCSPERSGCSNGICVVCHEVTHDRCLCVAACDGPGTHLYTASRVHRQEFSPSTTRPRDREQVIRGISLTLTFVDPLSTTLSHTHTRAHTYCLPPPTTTTTTTYLSPSLSLSAMSQNRVERCGSVSGRLN